MQEALRHEPWYRTDRFLSGDGSIAMARVSLGFVDPHPQPAVHEGSDSRIVLDGEIYDSDRIRRQLQRRGHRFQTRGQAEVLLAGYLDEGLAFFAGLDGRFSAAIWDGRSDTLVLLNDQFGTKPLYYSQTPHGILFASEIKALVLSPHVSRAPSHQGIAQFFGFGQLWNQNTLFESIQTLPAAGWISFSRNEMTLKRQRYWRLQPDRDLAKSSPADLLERVDSQFKRSVDVRLAGPQSMGISISGGLDARTMLGVADPDRTDLSCICLGMEGSLDRNTAGRLAHLADCPYHGYVLGEGFLSGFLGHLQRMVLLTDGHYLSQCIVMPTLPLYRKLGIQVLLRGHAGELMHLHKAYNFSLDRAAFGLRDARQLESWLLKRLSAYMLDGVEGQLFEFASDEDLSQWMRQSLQESLEETRDWACPINRISQLFMGQRTRRETAMSLAKFGSVVETRLPYVNADLATTLLSMPPEMRLGETIQSHILTKRRPEFLLPPNSNTGARLGAGPLVRNIQRAKLKVFAKMGVQGYQPYERLGLWLRRELSGVVDGILLDDECLDRGILRPDTVRHVLKQHASQRQNHTYLILAMMIFELGQRQFGGSDGGEALAERLTPQCATLD